MKNSAKSKCARKGQMVFGIPVEIIFILLVIAIIATVVVGIILSSKSEGNLLYTLAASLFGGG